MDGFSGTLPVTSLWAGPALPGTRPREHVRARPQRPYPPRASPRIKRVLRRGRLSKLQSTSQRDSTRRSRGRWPPDGSRGTRPRARATTARSHPDEVIVFSAGSADVKAAVGESRRRGHSMGGQEGAPTATGQRSACGKPLHVACERGGRSMVRCLCVALCPGAPTLPQGGR